MGNINKKGIDNLTKKTASVFGAAVAALTSIESNASVKLQESTNDFKTIELKKSKIKPITVLKLNIVSPENSIFVANHSSHGSHGSHSSHSSHVSGR